MDQTDFFKCLSDPTRLDIIKWVMARENVCVCELTELLQLSQPKISRHLALLRNLSVLLDQRQGQWVYYRVNPDLPEWANAVLKVIAQSAQTDRQTSYLNTSVNIYCD